MLGEAGMERRAPGHVTVNRAGARLAVTPEHTYQKKKILLGGPESVLRRLAYFPPSRETHIGPTHVTSSLGSATSQLHSQSPDMTVPHSSSRGAYNL